MFEPLIWLVFCVFSRVVFLMACLYKHLWMLYFMQASCKWASKFDVFIWWWDNLIMWWHDRLQAGIVEACQFYINCLTLVLTWTKSYSRSSPFVPPHIFCKECSLVSCKPLSLYTPNRGAVMRVPWPWIKARHPVRGHGCFWLGSRGGHPLERAI